MKGARPLSNAEILLVSDHFTGSLLYHSAEEIPDDTILVQALKRGLIFPEAIMPKPDERKWATGDGVSLAMPITIKTLRKILFLSALMLCVLAGYIALGVGTSPPPYPVEDFSKDVAYPVLKVVDGDTVKIDDEGKETTVRLIGVDTPETVHPNKPVEMFGKEASAFTKNLLTGESVYLRFDGNKTDKYGRMLAYLYRAPDGLFVNLEIIRQGYGHAYTQFPFKHMELFRAYERRAREAGKGLWGDVEVETSEAKASVPIIQAAPTDQAPDDVTVYITRTGAKYHRAGCRSLSKSQIPMSLKDAKARYSPCSVCNPPK